MIFVTVGTHEQQFDRLVSYVDGLKASGDITEDVVIQTGFCTYEPQHCQWEKLYPYPQMLEFARQARIMITHGGPSSFIMALQEGKVPIVVPRQKQFGEHVNDHQLEFCRAVAERQGNILLVDDMEQLKDKIQNYEEYIRSLSSELLSNNAQFNQELGKIADRLLAR